MLKAYGSVLLLQAATASATLVVMWLASHFVPPAQFGRYSLWLSLVMLGTSLLIGWPNAALLRFGREEWNQRHRLGQTLSTRLLLFLVTAFVAIALARLLGRQARDFLDLEVDPFLWIAFGIAAFSLVDIGIYANQATGRVIAYGYVPLVSRMIFLLGLSLAAARTAAVDWGQLAALATAGAIVAGAVGLGSLPRNAWLGFQPSQTTLKRVLAYSWAIPFGAVFAYLVNWVDAWVIRVYMGPGAVGLYTWGYQLAVTGSQALAPLAVVLSPTIIDARLAGDTARLNRYGARALRVMLLAGLVGSMLLSLVYPFLVAAVGQSYLSAYPILLILLSVLPFQLVGYLATPISNAYEKLIPRVVLISAVVATLNSVGDVLLVPVLGTVGAATASATAFAIGALLQLGLIARGVPKLSFPPVWQFGILGLAMPMAVLYLWVAGPLLGAAIAVAWGAALLLAARHRAFFHELDVPWRDGPPMSQGAGRALLLAVRWLVHPRSESGRNDEPVPSDGLREVEND